MTTILQSYNVTEDFKPYPYSMNIESGRMCVIQYRKTRLELMPKPYKTSCFDYKNIGYYSRSDYILKCKIFELCRKPKRMTREFSISAKILK